eukprot:gene23256-biopygen8519
MTNPPHKQVVRDRNRAETEAAHPGSWSRAEVMSLGQVSFDTHTTSVLGAALPRCPIAYSEAPSSRTCMQMVAYLWY